MTVEFVVNHSTVRKTTDAVSRHVEGMIITRGAVTKTQFDMVMALCVAQVKSRFELSELGASQAVAPIVRRLIHVPKADEPTSVRRVAHVVTG